jgi:hypothetical protein
VLTLKEDLEDASSLFVDQARDTLDTSSSSETSDGGFGDTLAVVERYQGRRRSVSSETKARRNKYDEGSTRRKEGEHVVSQDLPVSLGSSFSESLATWMRDETRKSKGGQQQPRKRKKKTERREGRKRGKKGD